LVPSKPGDRLSGAIIASIQMIWPRWIMKSIARFLLAAFLLLAAATAQFSVNGTELINATPGVNNPNNVDLKNQFGVDLVVEWRLAGVTVGSTTVQREAELSFEHNMAAGTYEIWVRDAGQQPNQAVKCGNLVVLP
jgi:hypothetical protein